MRARNMQSLTDAWKRRHPGIVIYGVGDDDHKKRRSGHNEDDTRGSLPEMEDVDNNPEHRALDGMLGPNFTRADAYAFIADLLADPAALARLIYIIFDGWIWSRSNGWKKRAFTGDPHDDHVHASGDAADDENSAGWPAVEGDDMDLKDKLGSSGPTVEVALQETYRASQKLLARPPVQPAPVDQAQLNAAVKAGLMDPEFLAAVAKAVIDEDHRRSAQ